MSSNKITEYLRLKDNHPTMVKLMKLYDLADELGIHLSFMGHTSIVSDNDRDKNLPDMLIEDIEDGNHIKEWPPSTEFKVVYKNPAYIQKQKEEQAEYLKKKLQEDLAKKQVEETRIRLEQARIAAQKEADERFLLAQLKEKYPNA